MTLLMHLRFPSCIKVGCLCRMPISPPIWCSFPCHVDIVRNWPVTRISAPLGSVAMGAWACKTEAGDSAQLPQHTHWWKTWMVAPRKIRKLATQYSKKISIHLYHSHQRICLTCTCCLPTQPEILERYRSLVCASIQLSPASQSGFYRTQRPIFAVRMYSELGVLFVNTNISRCLIVRHVLENHN